MHVWLFYNTVSIKKVNVQYTTLVNSLFSICLSKQKVWNPMRMKECNAKMPRLLLERQCEHVRFMRASKEETPPSINLLVVDSNALLTRLQFYLGSWQLEAEGLYSRDSGIMNSASLTSILFWILFPLIWDHGVRNPHFHRIPRFPGRRERFHSVMFRNIARAGS